MADNDAEYKFNIEAYSPETIPMRRLGEYMVEFARLLSNEQSVINFRKLERGSTVLVAAARIEADPKIRKRLQSVVAADAANDTIASFDRLNSMLREDNAVGRVLRRATSATEFSEALFLPGREIPEQRKIGPFSEPATVKAQLFRIGGRDETAHAQLIDSAGRIWNGDLTKDQAAKMAAASATGGLYRWFIVNGIARWQREEDGQWKLVDFHIVDFKLLDDTTLEEDILGLRKVEGSEWSRIEDPTAFIQELRKDDDGLH